MKVRTSPAMSLIAGAITVTLPAIAWAEDPFRISELYFDPPSTDVRLVGGQPFSQMYIELRGDPGLSLNNHYLVFLESENNVNSGKVDGFFDLSGMTMGTNGFMLLLPNGFNRTTSGVNSQARPGTAVYRNTGNGMSVGTMGFGEGPGSNIGFQSNTGLGDIENAGFSAFLINKGTGVAPALAMQVGTATGTLNTIPGWTIVDSIGSAESGEEDGVAYSKTFFSANPLTTLGPDTTNISRGAPLPDDDELLEVEYMARYGGATGSAPNDWFYSNLTDTIKWAPVPYNYDQMGLVVSGSHAGNPADPNTRPYGQLVRGTATPTPGNQTGTIESSPGVRLSGEGLVIQDNLGRANWPVPDGDLSQNTVVDQADLTIVTTHWLTNDPSKLGYWLAGDPSGDGLVNKTDLDTVMSHWPAFGAPGYSVPNFGILAGDINLDGTVNDVDLAVLSSHWQQSFLGYANGDFTYDGVVDINDLRVLGLNYDGAPATLLATLASLGVSPAAVPEPATAALGAIACTALLARRRKDLR